MQRAGFLAGLLAAWLLVMPICAPLFTPAWAQTASDSLLGTWLTADHSGLIAIRNCGGRLCARVVGQVVKPTETLPRDWRGRASCGLDLISDAAETKAAIWSGHILDPRDGHVYTMTLRPLAADRLSLRGYLVLPLFGESQQWTRYNGAPPPADCRIVTPTGTLPP